MLISKMIRRFDKELNMDEINTLMKFDEEDFEAFGEEEIRKIIKATALGVGIVELIFRAILVIITTIFASLTAGIIGVIATDFIFNRYYGQIDLKEVIRNMND